MLNKFTPFLILVVLALGLVLGAACGLTNRPTTAANGPTATPFIIVQPTIVPTAQPTVGTTQAGDRTGGMKFSGNLISANQANIAFQTGGRVKTLNIKEGDRVKAGAQLIILDMSAMEIQVAQAQAAYDLAKANFDKIKAGPTIDDITIAKTNVDRAKSALDQAQAAYDRVGGQSNPFIVMAPQSVNLQQAYSTYQSALAQYNLTITHPTDSELRAATAQVAQAQAALDLAKQNLTYAVLVAPIEGTIISLSPKAGEMVGAGTPVGTIADLTKMQVQVNLDETSLATVKLNQPVTLTLDALGGKTLAGHVSKIAWLGTATGGIVSVPVTIDIDSSDASIYPGLSALVSFQSKP
jgi:multidrug resistance efflux pump